MFFIPCFYLIWVSFGRLFVAFKLPSYCHSSKKRKSGKCSSWCYLIMDEIHMPKEAFQFSLLTGLYVINSLFQVWLSVFSLPKSQEIFVGGVNEIHMPKEASQLSLLTGLCVINNFFPSLTACFLSSLFGFLLLYSCFTRNVQYMHTFVVKSSIIVFMQIRPCLLVFTFCLPFFETI